MVARGPGRARASRAVGLQSREARRRDWSGTSERAVFASLSDRCSFSPNGDFSNADHRLREATRLLRPHLATVEDRKTTQSSSFLRIQRGAGAPSVARGPR